MEPKKCECGWSRPIVSLMTQAPGGVPDGIVPAYHCPECGKFYVPSEISPTVAAQMEAHLRAELARGRAAS